MPIDKHVSDAERIARDQMSRSIRQQEEAQRRQPREAAQTAKAKSEG